MIPQNGVTQKQIDKLVKVAEKKGWTVSSMRKQPAK